MSRVELYFVRLVRLYNTCHERIYVVLDMTLYLCLIVTEVSNDDGTFILNSDGVQKMK